MLRGRLLLFLWCSVILGAVSSSFRVDHHSCVSDYLKRISCSLNISDDLEFKSNNYSLRFTDPRGISSSSCLLVARGHGYHGDCKVIKDNDMFFIQQRYRIELCYNSTCRLVENTFIPSQRIKLTPPPELELQQTSDTINITCTSETYKSHRYLRDALQFEVFHQDSVSRQITIIHLDSSKPVESIDKKSELTPNTNYCLKARFKPYEGSEYRATWSEWSASVCWENKAEEEQENILFILLKFLSPVCLLAGLLLMVFCSPVVRMSIKTLAHTPTPAPFFQPLFQKHEGNLQDWLSHQSQFALPYKTEKDLIADAVTVVPRPIVKDPEESQAFLRVSLPHLTFPQSPTSYVGLPVMSEAPPLVTTICPGDTPYTQLPCSVWGFSISEVEVVASTPKDFLEMSHTDSGCSCEDLTQSPECSLPSSPVDESSPPRYCTDYCILNKTAEGVVPVLMSNESKISIPPDPLKTEG